MASLIHNRPGGFGPTYQGDLSSGFEDVILAPTATWFFFALLLLLIPFQLSARRHSTGRYGPVFRRKWHLYIKVLAALAVIAMSILEMVRLANLGYGIGLLPFVPAGVFVAILLMLTRTLVGSGLVLSITLSLYWAVSIAFQSVKLHTQVRLQSQFPRLGSPYPASDEIIDLSVLVGCLGVLLILEVIFPERKGLEDFDDKSRYSTDFD